MDEVESHIPISDADRITFTGCNRFPQAGTLSPGGTTWTQDPLSEGVSGASRVTG